MVPNLLWFLIIMNANLHFKNCVYIFFPEEEAEIREEKHISSDGKCNNPKYSLHFCIRKMLLILLSVLLSGTVFAERKVEQRSNYQLPPNCKQFVDCFRINKAYYTGGNCF